MAPSVGHRTICRSEGPSIGQGTSVSQSGPSVGQTGVFRLSEGPSAGQISSPSIKEYFVGQRGHPSLNIRGPSVGHKTICESEGVLRLSEGTLCRSAEGVLWLCRSD